MRKKNKLFALLFLFLLVSCSTTSVNEEITQEALNESVVLLQNRQQDNGESYVSYLSKVTTKYEEKGYVNKSNEQSIKATGIEIGTGIDLGSNVPSDPVVLVSKSLGGQATYSVAKNLTTSARGRYTLKLSYYLPTSFVSNALIEVRINGAAPFKEANSIVLPLYYEDDVAYENGQKNFDNYVNRYNDQMFPNQKRLTSWQTVSLYNTTYDTADPLIFDLAVSKPVITISNMSEIEIFVADLTLVPYVPEITHSEYLETVSKNEGAGNYELNAIDYSYKNSNNVRLSTEMTPSVYPFNKSRKLLNILTGWDLTGQEVSWKVNVDEPGLYPLVVHYYNAIDNFPIFRSIYVNGNIPFIEFKNYKFVTTGSNYKNETLHDENNEPLKVYLNSGENVITLKAETEPLNESYQNLMAVYNDINDFAIDIRKITGASVDVDRVYKLTNYFPETVSVLNAYKNIIYYEYSRISNIAGTQSSAVLSYFPRMIQLIEGFIKEPDDLPVNLTKFSSGDSCLAKLLADTANSLTSTSMVLDTIYITNDSSQIRLENATGIQNIGNSLNSLWDTFTSERYKTELHDGELNVWVNRALTYIELMQTMADNLFTPNTKSAKYPDGIKVNIRQMPGESNLILANAAGNTPDLALGINSGLPYEFALRGDAAYPMSDFADFWDIASQVPSGQLLSFVYQDKFYGLPETSSAEVMYVRNDIFDVIGDQGKRLNVPNTWDEVIGILPRLQSYGMNFYYPTSASGSLKSLSSTSQFIFQNNGRVVDIDNYSVDIRNENTIAGLKTLTDLYTIYALPTEVGSFYNSFRYGTLPIGIADVGMYLSLKYVAPELASKWSVSLIPGTKQSCSIAEGTCTDLNGDGTKDDVSRWYISNGSGAMIFKKNDEKKAKYDESWSFFKWWMSTDIQKAYSESLQSTFGPSFVWFSANKEAAKYLLVDKDVRDIILEAQNWIVDYAQIPGQYMLQRGLSNIWNSVVFDKISVANAIDLHKVTMDREIQRKLDEFGYYDDTNKVGIKEYKLRDYAWVNQCISNYKNNINTGNTASSACPI